MPTEFRLSREGKIILTGDYLGDEHIDRFYDLLKSCSDYQPCESWKLSIPSTITKVPKDKKHIQILYRDALLGGSVGHWVCSFYDGKDIFIYDSLNEKTLHKKYKETLMHLFPEYFENGQERLVRFPSVQSQLNGKDCGVFAIAFAISLRFGIKPDEVTYDRKLMREHLCRMFETDMIQHFPQDISSRTFEEVIPLSVIRMREADLTRKRKERRNKARKNKSNILVGNDDASNSINKIDENILYLRNNDKDSQNPKCEDSQEVIDTQLMNFRQADAARKRRERRKKAQKNKSYPLDNDNGICESTKISDRNTLPVQNILHDKKTIDSKFTYSEIVQSSFIHLIDGDHQSGVYSQICMDDETEQKKMSQSNNVNDTYCEPVKIKINDTLDTRNTSNIEKTKSEVFDSPTTQLESVNCVNGDDCQVCSPTSKKNEQQKHGKASLKKKRHIILLLNDKNVLESGGWLNSEHIAHFHSLVESDSKSYYKPQNTWLLQRLNDIVEVSQKEKHIQILNCTLPSGEKHWVCSYYDGNDLFIYDSLNMKMLYEDCKIFLCRLFPRYFLDERQVHFPDVQQQPNGSDCGVFAIAFATSLYFEMKPDQVRYDHKSMRKHLIELLESNIIKPFQLALDSGNFEELLSLPVSMSNMEEYSKPNLSVVSCQISIVNNVNDVKQDENQREALLDHARYERKRYHASLERKRAQKRRLYADNLISNRAKRRHLYLRNVEKIRALKRRLYSMNSKNICAKRRRLYAMNPEENLSKQKERYAVNIIKRRIWKREQYSKLLRNEKIRQKVIMQKHKSNKRYYRVKRKNKSIRTKKNYWSNRSRLVRIISDKLLIEDEIKKLFEAKRIVCRFFLFRGRYMRTINKKLKALKEKANVFLTLVADCSTIEDKLSALCGLSKHTATSENFYRSSTYGAETSADICIMNNQGQVINILPLIEGRQNKTWSCNDTCKTKDPNLIGRYEKFLKVITLCTPKKITELIKKDRCTKTQSNTKMGHIEICYTEYSYCNAISLPAQILSAHFPKVRCFKVLYYQLKKLHQEKSDLERALIGGNIEKLNEIFKLAQENRGFYKVKKTEKNLNETEIRKKYSGAFEVLEARVKDTPEYVCISCERLCYKKNVVEIGKMRKKIDNSLWNDLISKIGNIDLTSQYLCTYCKEKFRKGELPAFSILNHLSVDQVPEVISSLNTFEKVFIQLGKAFQMITTMETVANKKIPHRQKVSKLKGRVIHLPLPLQETLRKINFNTNVMNLDPELYILVRGVPTKRNVIWEEKVSKKKVFDAFTWLKNNNHLYSNIILPANSEDLSFKNISNREFQMENPESDEDLKDTLEVESDEEKELLADSNLQDPPIENPSETLLIEKKAMLTQIIDDNEKENHYDYEQFTIHPLYDKKIYETETALYQMLRIEDPPLNDRERDLDLLCFPDSYPRGQYGEHTIRAALQTHDFIKCRLKSKHSQFRLNLQYLFFLLNNHNIRAVSRGIYSKLNIHQPKSLYTAEGYLDALSKDLLESDLSTIFSSLRNTEQYWSIPRNNLECMVDHYGPATWFLTLSPSEWTWDELGEYIRRVNHWIDLSIPTSELIARDPVSTSRYLDNIFRGMLDFICHKDNPIGKVRNYFWRREYQGRGIQHFHLLIWIEDAPVLEKSSIEEVSKFILEHITCHMPDPNESPILYERVCNYQSHKHNNYCLRAKKEDGKVVGICRFGFPRPVTDELVIRDVATSIAGRKNLKRKSRLYDLPREKNEVYINDYNPTLLTAWNGNIDIQYVGERSKMLCAYILKYISKGEKEKLASKNSILDSKNIQNKSLLSCIYNIAFRFMNNRECGALEAADTLLGIPLYGTDPETLIRWIDVRQIRSRKLKTRKEIEKLPGQSNDLYCVSLEDSHYPCRPKNLENMSLYEFAKWYDITKNKSQSEKSEYFKLSNNYYIKRRQKRGYLINHRKFNIDTQPENHFFSLLFLFKPWRELEDLKNGYDTYVEAFHGEKLHLTEAVEYHENLKDLQDSYQKAADLIQKKSEEMQEQNVSQDDPENPIGLHHIVAGEAMQDHDDLAENVQNIDVEEMISKLNTDQKRVFDKVIETVQSDKSILRLYVSGEGGTGKSYLIQTIKCWISQNLKKGTAVAAPTGIAAFNVNGITIHRLLMLPVEHGHTPKYTQLNNSVLKVLRASQANDILYIIDEVSMVSNITLLYIHQRLTEIFGTIDSEDGWFGRRHILVFGDLLQLPPVHEDPAFVDLSRRKIDKYLGCLGAVNLWATLFDYEELTINMRQQGDETYRNLLSRIRIGLVTSSDCDILNERKIKFKGESLESRLNELCDYICDLPSDTVCLLPTNNMCNVLNDAMLKRIPSEEILLVAEDKISFQHVKVNEQRLQKKIFRVLSNNDDDNSRTGGLPKKIIIKIGTKVMIRRNIDASLGLVNGTIAKVIAVLKNPINNSIDKIKLLLSSGLEYSIERLSVKFEVLDRVYVERVQFPITLSYGITVHKSQGLSLQNAIVDVGTSIFACGQTYVALSRVTSSKGLHIINFDPSSVKASDEAITEYNRLKRHNGLEKQLIDIPKGQGRKIKDTVWCLSEKISSVQQPQEETKTGWVMRGLQNNDKTSSYANAVLQCLLRLNTRGKNYFNCDEPNALTTLACRYEHAMLNLNANGVREQLGQYFSSSMKQDASRFFTALYEKFDYMKNFIKNKMKTTIRCTIKSCNNTTIVTESNNALISIPINEMIGEKKSCNLNDLLKQFTSKWHASDKTICENCKNNKIISKNEIIEAKEVIVIHFMLFSSHDGKIRNKNKINLSAIPSTKVTVAEQTYKAMSAVFHHGANIEEGHFTALCREKSSSGWISAHDTQIRKIHWPKNAQNIYLLFLQKIENRKQLIKMVK